MDQQLLARAADVRLAIFDVDGVLTTGSLHYTEEGREHKVFHARDGLGMKMLMKEGVDVAIITGRTSAVVSHRMAELGIDHVYQGCDDKLATFKTLLAALRLDPSQVAMMGDDIVDLPILNRVGLAMAPKDAHSVICDAVHWRSTINGGCGAAREACDLILKAQGKLDQIVGRMQ